MRFVLLALLVASPADAADPALKAGAFAQDVTPKKFPISVNGGFVDRQATKANDPLHARALVLDDGTTAVALVVVDSCLIPRPLMDAAKAKAAKATGIPATNMLISATHTHTAPTVTSAFGSDPDPDYVTFLADGIATAITKAHAARVPAKVAFGSIDEPRELFNRRWKTKPGAMNLDPFGRTTDKVKMNPGHQNPNIVEQAGPVDPQVSVIAVRDAADKPLSLYANYGLHYVGDLPPLSADYFGVFGELIGPKLGTEKGSKFVGILSNGTSGDVNNVDFANPPKKTKPGERCRAVAEVVAIAAKKAEAGAMYSSTVSVAAAEEELEFKVRKPTAAEIERAKGIIAAAGGKPLTKADQVYARETVEIAKYPDTVKLKVQAMRIGDQAIVAIPCEVFAEIGLKIKKESPVKRTFVVSLANGYNGYLPTPAQHELGGYETWRARSSYLEVTASDRITATALKLLKAVK